MARMGLHKFVNSEMARVGLHKFDILRIMVSIDYSHSVNRIHKSTETGEY